MYSTDELKRRKAEARKALKKKRGKRKAVKTRSKAAKL
jgi:hypothetical protein